MDDDVQFAMVQQDPPRALPDTYRDIKNNIERVRMSASGKWFLIARFDTRGKAGTRRLTLTKRKEYALFEFHAGLLDPPEPPFTAGLWCKWIGQKKAAKVHAEPEPERPGRLRSVGGK